MEIKRRFLKNNVDYQKLHFANVLRNFIHELYLENSTSKCTVKRMQFELY